jgi:hypothetical protein
MVEQGSKIPSEATTKKSRLSAGVGAFVQLAFAEGVVEKIDKEKQSATLEERERWEKRKWLLVRYVFDDQSTLEKVRKYSGVNDTGHVSKLYYEALTRLWRASAQEVQQKFPLEYVLRGKSKGPPGGHEVTSETRVKLSTTQKGHEKAPKTRARMSAGQRERWRRERENKEQVIFQDPKSQDK